MAKKVKKTTKTKVSAGNKAVKLPIMPLGDRVLVKELGEEEMVKKTASGIILPESADRDSGGKRGKVVAVGSGKWENGKLISPSVKVGETVLYQWGDSIKIGGEEYIIVSEGNIVAVLNS